MSQFPLIARYLPGLNIWNDAAWSDRDGKGFNAHMIKAKDLEAALAKGTAWYSRNKIIWSAEKSRDDLYETLSIGIHEIQPESEELKLLTEVYSAVRYGHPQMNVMGIIDKIGAFLSRSRK